MYVQETEGNHYYQDPVIVHPEIFFFLVERLGLPRLHASITKDEILLILELVRSKSCSEEEEEWKKSDLRLQLNTQE